MRAVIVVSLAVIGLFVGTFVGVATGAEEAGGWGGLAVGVVGGILLARQTPRARSARRDRAEQRIRNFREQYPNQTIRRRPPEEPPSP
jgi:uncharacterized membrane protein